MIAVFDDTYRIHSLPPSETATPQPPREPQCRLTIVEAVLQGMSFPSNPLSSKRPEGTTLPVYYIECNAGPFAKCFLRIIKNQILLVASESARCPAEMSHCWIHQREALKVVHDQLFCTDKNEYEHCQPKRTPISNIDCGLATLRSGGHRILCSAHLVPNAPNPCDCYSIDVM